jgi:hypothetical protein
MQRDSLPSVDPSVLTVSFPRDVVAGAAFDFDVVVRNLGTAIATDVRCAIDAPSQLVVALTVPSEDGFIDREATAVIPSLAAGRAARIRGTATIADDTPSMELHVTIALNDASGLVHSAVRTVVVTARDTIVAGEAVPVSVASDEHDLGAEATASVEASVVDVVPGQRVAWTITALLPGGTGDDYGIELQALRCDIERGSFRALVGDASIAIPTTRRGGSLLARVAALCALDRLVLVCDGITASPHVAGAAIALEVAIARGDRSISARASIDVRSQARFACIPEAIAVRDPLTAGTTARVSLALVNVGTASAHGVRVSGSVEGANGAIFTLAKNSRDDMTPARTELIEGRLVIPAPLRDGTLVTLTALVSANGCETTSIRRVVAVRSFAAFSCATSSVAFDENAPLRPHARRTIAVTLVNEGTDRAEDVRIAIALPPWLACRARVDASAAVIVVPSLAAGERYVTVLDVAATSAAPVGPFRIPAEVSWVGGTLALTPLPCVVETHAAFAEVSLETDAMGAPREPDDTIAYRLDLTNTGDGTCRELRIRAAYDGPATYARASFAVNGRRVRDVDKGCAVFADGIVLEDVPVGAAIACMWSLIIDADLQASAAVGCRAILTWDGEGECIVEAPVVAVAAARAFPSRAVALPARLPHAAIVCEPDNLADTTIAGLHTTATNSTRGSVPHAFDATMRSRLRCDYLEGTSATSGLVAILDLRIFLPFAIEERRDRDEAAKSFAMRAFVRAVDRIAIGMRLGVTLLRSDAIVSDELREALAVCRDDLRDASAAALLRFVAEEFAAVEGGADASTPLTTYLDALRALFVWWCTREEELADLLAADMPPATAAARAAVVDALALVAERAVA